VKNTLIILKSPVVISFLFMVPFLILELVNRRSFNEGFPFPLFALLWLLPLIFIVTLMPIVRNVRAGNSILVQPMILAIRVVALIFVAWMWFGIVIDQMPCFMGVPLCD
jgi:hypothetical protein